ncbi:chloride channel protein [Flavobacterium sp. MFBS3-15]|uniref:chloride channel protein n=1 Tax=Flavobacterium sp. MFBS3-15 TaxID=2989816 RepID=UPI0022359597|nr:chloride channel protein [Flavobacterium sp. MFBS3-15]MCW4468395.1 chloride channel protein [Flavobacterium sp. MFBS3-15]
MPDYSIRKIYPFVKYQKLIIASLIIGFLAAFLAVSLKKMTDHYEEVLFAQSQNNIIYILLFPLFGLSLIYILRQYLFKKKENKGIKEVFESTATGKGLPSYKIPSHFINGLITVSFGGSTGIEVSTVVSSAAIGSLAQEKEKFLKKYKSELICAGITAGITALFCTPFAGLLFAYEVIAKKLSKVFVIANVLAAAIAYAFVLLIGEKPLFTINITQWHLHAAPWLVMLGVLCGLNAVYMTKCVMFFKKHSQKIASHYHRILVGAAIISALIFILPQLYGDGYHAIRESIRTANTAALTLSGTLIFLGILLLKPVITSVTLSAGGDGGVFAPSLFIGAFLGLFTGAALNTWFDAGIIPINFMVMGMAAMLSASIHAPFTALFLICGLVGDYTLFLPVLIVCLISKYTAQAIYPHTVYSLSANKQ